MPPENSDTKQEASLPRASRKAFRGPAFIEVYANTSQGAFTPWDIEITFGRLALLEGEPAAEELVAVVFSPHHAKAVAKVLHSAVESWEKNFGEIVLSAAQQPAGVNVAEPKTSPNPAAKAAKPGLK
ncbi:MAG TPA: DUF3467 domain-containing protein [Casimicrobiaceae bacterium]|jgi:hypothetical protein